jgi:hypothetical protein
MLIPSSVSFVHPAVGLPVFIPSTFDQHLPVNIRSLSASKPFHMQQMDIAAEFRIPEHLLSKTEACSKSKWNMSNLGCNVMRFFHC